MKAFAASLLKEAVQGEIKGNLQDQQILSVAIDSRKVVPGGLFIAMKGVKVDSHRFIPEVWEKGAVCIFVSKEHEDECPVEVPEGKLVVVVENPVKALGQLGAWYRQWLDVKIVAITGSVGKTSAKDMIAAGLSGKFKVFKTQGNLNNEFGVPLTLLSIEADTEVAVIEMGMNHFGEIRYLAGLARPDLGVITNIGVSHIEFLGSQQGILKAKTEMLEYMDEKNRMFLCGDDPLLKEFSKTSPVPCLLYGFEEGCDIRAAGWNASEGMVAAQVENGPELKAQTLGRHMVYTMLAAYGIGKELGMTEEEIQKGLASFVPSAMRMNEYTTKRFHILDDSYNAAPASVKAAIDVLCQQKENQAGRAVAILGDMFEMGFYSETGHREVGQYVAAHPVELLICAGHDARFIAEEVKKADPERSVVYFENTRELQEKLPEYMKDGDLILVKASRGMAFDKIVAALQTL